MSALINATGFALLLFSVAGAYGTWHLLLNNGTIDHMVHIRDAGPRFIPGTREPLKTFYTGIPAIDYQLTVLDLFFWEQVDGSMPHASLFCFHFATQAACGWGLLVIESLRYCNKWRIISLGVRRPQSHRTILMDVSIGLWGILIQNAAYAIILPIYLSVYLWTSPAVSSRRISHLMVDPFDISAVLASITAGYVLPTIFMCLPAPSFISFEEKQTYIAIWQLFPVWVSAVQAVLPYLILKFEGIYLSKPPKPCAMELLRTAYTGLIAFAGIGQVSTTLLSAASKFFPDLFTPEFRGAFGSSKVFRPGAITSSTKMPSIGSGAHLLLQYDELVGSSAMMLWASVLFVHSYRKGKTHPSVISLSLISNAIWVLILTGPLGYAVACIWARDELIVAEVEEDGKKDR